ncbi:MAG: alpha/beta hydrolase [Planctomycetota bacterium]|nr:alpha/beta hydrolase [Planctomycetota bacterium]MDA1212619.1 alpha/beta hydrolase [Planctomycetota bacterium]
MKTLVVMTLTLVTSTRLFADEPLNVWPDLAPGETTRLIGEKLPYIETEIPPVTRVVNITRPTMTVHIAPKPNGSAVVILPGGGFAKVVPDKEGTEAAEWLNKQGVSAFVLSYRTSEAGPAVGWKGALQDAQRAMSLIRSRADEWGLDPQRIGLVGFSAGGQIAARLLCAGEKLTYDRLDEIDAVSHRPDFAVLIYPWNLYDPKADALVDGLAVPSDCPASFIVHTDDDGSTSLGAVMLYAGLKKHKIPSALHVYHNGGHGYGLRPVEGSQISSWTDHATHWLETRGVLGE